jgi:hypothetical protein
VLHDILKQAVNTGLHVQLSGSRRNAFHLWVVFLRLLHLYCFGRHPTAIQGRQNMHADRVYAVLLLAQQKVMDISYRVADWFRQRQSPSSADLHTSGCHDSG